MFDGGEEVVRSLHGYGVKGGGERFLTDACGREKDRSTLILPTWAARQGTAWYGSLHRRCYRRCDHICLPLGGDSADRVPSCVRLFMPSRLFVLPVGSRAAAVATFIQRPIRCIFLLVKFASLLMTQYDTASALSFLQVITSYFAAAGIHIYRG